MELPLHRLRMLREFRRRGTITEAAAVLHYTPSAVSQQLDALEREVGAELLERVGRQLRLTELGRTLTDYADQILTVEERARIALEEAQETLTADLTVGVLATIAASLVPPTLATLAERHPGIRVETREIDPEDAFGAVRHGDLDLAFVLGYPDAPLPQDTTLQFTLVGVEQLHLVSARGQLAVDSPIALTDLAEQPWVASGPDTDFGRTLWTVCRQAEFEPRIAHQIDEQTTAMAMVAAGLGITLVADLGLPLRPQGVDISPLRRPIMRHVFVLRRTTTLARPSEQAFVQAAVDTADLLGLIQTVT